MTKNKEAIEQVFGVINRLNPDTSLDKWAAGWRLETKDGSAHISPRLSTEAFYWWLYGYETGLRKGLEGK